MNLNYWTCRRGHQHTSPNLTEHIELAQAAGFHAAAQKTREQADRAAKMAKAYEFYRFVSEEKIQAFQAKLKEKTLRQEGKYPALYENYDILSFTHAQDYPDMPPPEIMEKVKQTVATGIFDALEVAKIESTRVYRDPIIFGRIQGCPDRFYVCQYDDDVKIEDLLGEHEG